MLAEPPFSLLEHFERVDDAIDKNAELADAILATGLSMFGLEQDEPAFRKVATGQDMDKSWTTLRQFFRDWSLEGAPEREVCYGPILRDLDEEFGSQDKSNVNVLVPGAGLGRLVFEICKAGFSTEGNEVSYHALIASNFILNHTKHANQFTIYPWAHSFSNHISKKDQLESVTIPDVHPGVALNLASEGMPIHAFERLGMAAADFVDAYSGDKRAGQFHAIATAFFIDTASNFISYIEAIKACLRQGGLWSNSGPLLWHFEESAPKSKRKFEGSAAQALDVAQSGSFELSNEDVILLIERSGFKIEKSEVLNSPAGYIQNPKGMLQNTYKLAHWVARKI
jgi:carnosine N-methyltransferase